MKLIPTTMCFTCPDALRFYQDRTCQPVAIYCEATGVLLGQSTHEARRASYIDDAGVYHRAWRVMFAGADLIGDEVPGRTWISLSAVDGGAA